MGQMKTLFLWDGFARMTGKNNTLVRQISPGYSIRWQGKFKIIFLKGTVHFKTLLANKDQIAEAGKSGARAADVTQRQRTQACVCLLQVFFFSLHKWMKRATQCIFSCNDFSITHEIGHCFGRDSRKRAPLKSLSTHLKQQWMPLSRSFCFLKTFSFGVKQCPLW